MQTRLALILALALYLPGAYHAAASPRQSTNPTQRALEAQQQRLREERAQRQRMAPGLLLVPPSPNQVIGKVTRVNHTEGFVVGWLHSRYLNLSGHIITRDERLRTTAVLSLGSARNNRAAGLHIESGAPSVGDEIVVVTRPVQTDAQPAAGGGQRTASATPYQPEGTLPSPAGQNRLAPQTPPDERPHTSPHPQNQAPYRQGKPAVQQSISHFQPAQQPQSGQTSTVLQPQEQPILIPANRLPDMSTKPTVETKITVTVH